MPKIAAPEARKHDSKGKASSANARAFAAGGELKTLLAQKSKTPGIEVKKHSGGKVEPANGGGDGRALRQQD